MTAAQIGEEIGEQMCEFEHIADRDGGAVTERASTPLSEPFSTVNLIKMYGKCAESKHSIDAATALLDTLCGDWRLQRLRGWTALS